MRIPWDEPFNLNIYTRALLTSKQSIPGYSLRQGVEGTVSQGVWAFGMRRSRYVGSRKTHLQHIAIASAINIVRLVAWLQGERPKKTRISAFAGLFYYQGLPAGSKLREILALHLT